MCSSFEKRWKKEKLKQAHFMLESAPWLLMTVDNDIQLGPLKQK